MEATQNIDIVIKNKKVVERPKENVKVPMMVKLIRLGFNTLGRICPALASKLAFQLFTTPRMRAKHQQSDNVLESAHLFEFMYGRHILKAYEWGQGDKIILLVHGWESRGTAMRSFVPGLVEKGFRVVAFDGPAHGHSAGKRTNLPHFGGAIRAIINHLGGVHSIITHSFGGASTVFALANTDNNISIRNLVMIATPSSMKNIYTGFISYIKAPKSVATAFRKIMEGKVGMSLEDAHLGKQFQKMAVNKTMIVHDKEDKLVPFSEVKPVLANWKNTVLLTTSGFGHFHLMKNPEVIFRVTEFIDDDVKPKP